MSEIDGFTRLVGPQPPFRSGPLGVDERVVVRMHPSARRLAIPAALFVLLSGCASYAAFAVPEDWMRIAVGCAYGALVVLIVVLPVLSWWSRRVVVTTRRVTARSGLLVRSEQELALIRCASIVVRRGPLQAIARCADVQLRTRGTEMLVLRDSPYPRQLAAALRELADATRGDRGP